MSEAKRGPIGDEPCFFPGSFTQPGQLFIKEGAMLSNLMLFMGLFLQEEEYGGGAAGGVFGALFLIYLVVLVFYLWVGWKIFVKAGKPGWAVIIPIYNLYVMLEIVGRPAWWLILCLIPFVNFIVLIILIFDTAKSFGKDTGFGLGMLFLGFIFYPILAFGSAKYVGPAAKK